MERLAINGIPGNWRVSRCDTFLSRALGQLAAAPAERQRVWLFRPCSAVHTLFPATPIDVAFCDRHGQVIRIVAPLRRRRWAGQRGAVSVWEFPAGVVAQLALRCGDRLSTCA